MLKFLTYLPLLLGLQSAVAVTNDTFVSMGANATFAAAGSVLLNSPMPSLDGGDVVIAPAFGRTTVEAHNDNSDSQNSGTAIRYYGSVKGENAGLTLTFHMTKDFSFFVIGGGSHLKGEFREESNGAVDKTLTDFDGQTIAGGVGMQYRLIGSDDSTFALGLLAGPMYYSSRSKAKYSDTSAGSGTTDMRLNPSGPGALAGVQFMIRAGGFRINPYVKVTGEIGDVCKKVELQGGPATAADFTCHGKNGYVFAPSITAGFGLLVGYKWLLINIVNSTDESNHLRPSSTTVSVGIPL